MSQQRLTDRALVEEVTLAGQIHVVEDGTSKRATISQVKTALEIPSTTNDIAEGTNLYYTEDRVAANSAVAANTAKRSYPSGDETKLATIETGATADQTAEEIKTAYESNTDTNAYTDAEKTKLTGIEAGAQVNTVVPADIADFETTTELNARDTANRNTDNHTDGATNKVFTATEKTKLGTVETGAEVNTVSPADIPTDTDDITEATNLYYTEARVSANADVAANTTKISFDSASSTKLAGIETGAQVNTVTSVASKTGAVTLVKGDVGLGNVDNTSDANKPVSTAQQTALDAKVDYILTSEASSATPTITGTALRNDYVATALVVNATLAAPSGTANASAVLRYRITASGGTRTIGYNAGLLAGNETRTTSLAAGETLTQLYERNESTWVCVYNNVI